MKESFKILPLLLATIMAIVPWGSFAGEIESPCTLPYQGVLDRFYAFLSQPAMDKDIGEGGMGVWEAVVFLEDMAQGLEKIGYTIQDVSGDGIRELLIGAIPQDIGNLPDGREIFAVYTCKDGKAQLTLEGWARNRYYSLGGARFFHQGSSSAMDSQFGTFALSPDGVSLVWEDYYFSAEKEGKPDEVSFYHNQSGSTNPSEADELRISETQFWQMEDAITRQVQTMELLPFSQYKPSLGEEPAIPVQAIWAKDGQQTQVVFTTAYPVYNFRILALSLTNMDEKGKPVYSIMENYAQDRLLPEHPLQVSLSFTGSVPNNGIAYTDGQGAARYFALEISGMDGSLMLNELHP